MLNYQRVVHFSYHNQTTRSGMSNHRVAAQTKSWCLNVSQQVFLSKKPSCSIPYTPCLDYATRLGQNFRIRHQRHPRLISSCFGPISPPIIWPWYLRKKIWMMILAHPRSPQKMSRPFERPHARCGAQVGCRGKAALSSERNPSSMSRRRWKLSWQWLYDDCIR